MQTEFQRVLHYEYAWGTHLIFAWFVQHSVDFSVLFIWLYNIGLLRVITFSFRQIQCGYFQTYKTVHGRVDVWLFTRDSLRGCKFDVCLPQPCMLGVPISDSCVTHHV